jgi:hypothetical protein
MPRLGFGMYENGAARETCLHAFDAGYRYTTFA